MHHGKVRLEPATGAMTIIVPLDKEEESALVGCAVTPEAKAKIKDAVESVR